MTIEQLMELSAAELKSKAGELGIEYGARATKAELSELIYAKTTNQEESANVAQTDEADSDAVLNNDDFEIVAGQLIKVITQKDGEEIEGLTPLDDLLFSFEPLVNENIELLNENDTLKKENEGLKMKNAELEKLAYREVIGHPSQEEDPESKPSLEWDDELELMAVRVRVLPNSGVLNRMRAGLSFTNQYRALEVDKETFKALISDNYLQVEPLKNVEQLDE